MTIVGDSDKLVRRLVFPKSDPLMAVTKYEIVFKL